MIKQLLLVIFGAALGAGALYYGCPSKGRLGCSNKAHELRLAVGKLWADHVIWTRDYIIAAIAGAPDAEFAVKRLMKNQEDLGHAIVPFYGKEAGAKLTELLKEHIAISADVVSAAKANDTGKLEQANARWYKNADQLAEFLSKANPNWPKEMMRKMLNEHLALTTKEVTSRLKKNWEDDIATFDQVFNQALTMADDLTAGIVKQFPDRF